VLLWSWLLIDQGVWGECDITMEAGNIQLNAWTTTVEFIPVTCASVLLVDGQVMIDGPLHLDIPSPSTVATQSTFNIVHASSIHGQFDAPSFIPEQYPGIDITLHYTNDTVSMTIVTLDSVQGSTSVSDVFEFWSEATTDERWYMILLGLFGMLTVLSVVLLMTQLTVYPKSNGSWLRTLLFIVAILGILGILFYWLHPSSVFTFMVIKVIGVSLFMLIIFICCIGRCQSQSKAGMDRSKPWNTGYYDERVSLVTQG
jgi:hypothetical protein